MKVAATVDQFAPRVAPHLRSAVDALPPATPDLAQLDAAADLIDAWLAAGAPLLADGSGNIPYPGVTIYRAWRTQVQCDTFDDELGEDRTECKPELGEGRNRLPDYEITRVSDNADAGGDLFSLDALFLRALGGPSLTFPTHRDYFRNVVANTNPGPQATLIGALRTALVTLTTQYGTADPTQWLTPKITVQFDETSAAAILYGGPTVIEREDRGTMNELVELLPTLSSQIVVPPGNSGHIPGTAPFPEPPRLRDRSGYESFQYHALPSRPPIEGRRRPDDHAALASGAPLARTGLRPQNGAACPTSSGAPRSTRAPPCRTAGRWEQSAPSSSSASPLAAASPRAC